MKNELAISGGTPVIKEKFSVYNTIGEEEQAAVAEVMRSGILSDFVGAPGENFLGGQKVRAFEEKFAASFDVKNAVSVNSWTSGLVAIIGALGVEPGDEILVTPWTMCASASAILHWNAIPVFVDIDPVTFCIDPSKIEEKITDRTRAILSVDIFGQSADMTRIIEIAKKRSLKVISDCAQAPGATYHKKLAGTMGDIGGFSFNYHKHIHTGEGGMIVTNDDDLARRCQLIRNHAEAAVNDLPRNKLVNLIGHNFRLGEIESAIGISQLDKLSGAIGSRQNAANKLDEALSSLPGLTVPKVREHCTHVYYFYGMQHDESVSGVSRDEVHKALVAEGVPFISNSYQCLHLLPMYREKICYGVEGFPWNINKDTNYIYDKGICPVAEDLNANSFLGLFLCGSNYEEHEIDLLIQAFQKVYNNLDELPKL